MTNPVMPFGASQEEWAHFSLFLGLTEDLLPVVSNPAAVISPDSKMKSLGKTPSRYNHARQVAGIPKWTDYHATDADIVRWSKEEDYGICIQTRTLRALDVDIPDPDLSAEVRQHLEAFLPGLCARTRADSSKFLVPIWLPGEYAKRVIKTSAGIIEFLADGQQFIAAGTHPGGSRYDWKGGFPEDTQSITPEEFENLWSSLADHFAIEETRSTTDTRKAVLAQAVSGDPVALRLIERDLVLSSEPDGRMHIVCPFADDHSGDSSESSTTYFPAHTGGYERGNFKCLHAHCADRSFDDYLRALDLADDPSDDFEALGEMASIVEALNPYSFKHASAFASGKPPRWIIKGLLPEAELIVIYGPPASGKSFFVLDAGMCVARGASWRGQTPVAKGNVAYICAEGAAGFRNRLNAYSTHYNIDLEEACLYVLGAGPNFMKAGDVSKVIASLKSLDPVKMIVVDTLARVMAGADENSGQDMGMAIVACKALHEATGATIVLIHHSGKDASKGSRGHSSLLGAADAEIEIVRNEQHRAAVLTKVKDGPGEGTEYGFELETVKLGADEDMEEITSCVVSHKASASGARTEKRSTGGAGGSHEKLVLRVLADLQSNRLDDTPVPYADLVEHCIVDMAPPDEGQRDRRRDVVRRAAERLSANRRLEIHDGGVRMAEDEQ